MRQIQKKIRAGTMDVATDDTFNMFISATNIRYCYYSETQKILGNTYGMCVLQVCQRSGGAQSRTCSLPGVSVIPSWESHIV